MIGNPHDGELLAPAVEAIVKRFGAAPRLVTADRGYQTTTAENDLTKLGVTQVAIPTTGKPSAARAAIEHDETLIKAVEWRTGCEGRISHLKRDWAWRRTRLGSHAGARIWCGHGVFAHDLTKIVRLGE